MYLVINKWVINVKVSNFSGQYLRNHWTLDIGVLGYIGIVWPKEHSPEVWSVPPVTPCITDIYDSVSKRFNVMEGQSLRPRISMIITCKKRFSVDKAGREIDHWYSSCARDKKPWSSIRTSPVCLYGVNRDKLTFCLPFIKKTLIAKKSALFTWCRPCACVSSCHDSHKKYRSLPWTIIDEWFSCRIFWCLAFTMEIQSVFCDV